MKSYDIVDFGAPLKMFDRPTPTPTGAEVLLRVTAAGVCHSDIHMWDGYFDMGGGKKMTQSERGLKLPHTPGHETVGELVLVGPEAGKTPEAATLKVGGQYLVYPWIGCGACEMCASGDEHICAKPNFIGVHRPGGYSEFIIVPHPRYLLDIADLPATEAAPYACSGVTTYSALLKVGPMLKERPIVIIGAGGLGLMALSIHSAMGGKAAVVVDISSRNRAAAIGAGAAAAIDGRAPDVAEQIKRAVGGPVLAVVDLVGSGDTVGLGIQCLSKGGKVIVVGLYGGQVSLSTPLLPQRAMTLQGSYVGSLSEMRQLLALVRQGKLSPIPIQVRPLAETASALADLRDGKVVGRMVLTPE